MRIHVPICALPRASSAFADSESCTEVCNKAKSSPSIGVLMAASALCDISSQVGSRDWDRIKYQSINWSQNQ